MCRDKIVTIGMIESCRGMKRKDAAIELGLSRYYFEKILDGLRINRADMFGPSGNIKYTRAFFDDKLNLSVAEISEKFSINIDTIRRAIKRVGLGAHYGLIKYYEKDCLETSKLTSTIRFVCMSTTCNRDFTKEISNDVPEHKRKKLKFFCSTCRENSSVETLHSYTGF